MHVTVANVPFGELRGGAAGESSASVRERVVAARARQSARYATLGVASNAALPAAAVRHYCAFDADALAALERATRDGLSARAFDRVARVARTIADLAASESIAREHALEALAYRALDNRRLAA